MKVKLLKTAVAALTFTLMTAPAVHAGAFTITDLYNTGVDGSGNALGNNVADTHYSLIVQPAGGTFAAETVSDVGFPFPPWFANNANSRWIGPDSAASANGAPGNYTYRTTFSLAGDVDLGTVSISGMWGSDNTGPDILINGASTGNATTNQFGSPTAFSIASGFVVGLNTLDFMVVNAGSSINPTGLRVDQVMGMYDVTSVPVVEPGMGAIFGLGLAGLAFARRRKAA